MSRPQPAAACEHVRDGTRPHWSRGMCSPCYRRARYQPARRADHYTPAVRPVAHRFRTPLPADFDWRLLLALYGTSCPARYCRWCGRRIGDSCAVCEPARVGLDAPDARAARWVRGAG